MIIWHVKPQKEARKRSSQVNHWFPGYRTNMEKVSVPFLSWIIWRRYYRRKIPQSSLLLAARSEHPYHSVSARNTGTSAIQDVKWSKRDQVYGTHTGRGSLHYVCVVIHQWKDMHMALFSVRYGLIYTITSLQS